MKEFDFDSVGKRMPYSVPEGFFEEAKAQASAIATRNKRGRTNISYRIAIVAAVVLMICGVATLWFEEFYSPESRYERLLAEVSSEVLWEFACEYDTSFGSEEIFE